MPVDGRGWLPPLAYLLLALPVVLFHAIAMPPFQGADEDNHFLRVDALSRGELVGTRFSAVSAGGFIDHTALEAAHALDGLKFHPDRHATPELLAEMRRFSWRPVQVVPADFGNTAIYPPWFYTPAAIAVFVARADRAPVAASLLLARLATAACGLAIAFTALTLARRGRAVLFAVLSLPMTLALLGSCAQDGLLIPSCALAAALLDRAGQQPRAAVMAGLVLGLVVAARPPYATLLLFAAAGQTRFRAAWPLAAAIVVPLLWFAFGLLPVQVGFRPGDGVSAAGQLASLAADPWQVPGIALRTLSIYGKEYAREFVGVLGWLDTPLAAMAYPIAGAMLAGALLIEVASSRQERPRWLAPLALVLIIVTMAAVFGAQYLSWTTVGGPLVEGIQGRYFLPIAAFVGLALPAWGGTSPSLTWVRASCWSVIYLAAAANLWFVPTAIIARYYG